VSMKTRWSEINLGRYHPEKEATGAVSLTKMLANSRKRPLHYGSGPPLV